MRKYIGIMLLIILLVNGCGTKKQEIPKDISEEFYNDMLKANELIEKSIDSKYFDDVINNEEMQEYVFPKKNDIQLTNKEQLIVNTYKDLLAKAYSYYFDYNNNYDYEEEKREFEEKYNQFKALLELQ